MENSQEKFRHLLYCPFTGLGLYGGFRGNRWLRNRIEVFKHFTMMSLLRQTNQNFTLWVSWRPEERGNKYVKTLEVLLKSLFGSDRVVFTYYGLCFWDDKYPDEEANSRLMESLHKSLAELVNHIGDVDDVIMTIQPSDDCYNVSMVDTVQRFFSSQQSDALGYQKGYLMNYQTCELKEYNPETNPPFFSLRFKKNVFIEPFRHAKHTGPYKSHEYVPEHMKYTAMESRGFIVGTHGENVSTHYNHPYGGEIVDKKILENFGLANAHPLKIRYSIRKQLMRKLPHGWQRKLRYWFGERLSAKIYYYLRN